MQIFNLPFKQSSHTIIKTKQCMQTCKRLFYLEKWFIIGYKHLKTRCRWSVPVRLNDSTYAKGSRSNGRGASDHEWAALAAVIGGGELCLWRRGGYRKRGSKGSG